jgi:glycosyltransferase involved in cell wall biosynthesis
MRILIVSQYFWPENFPINELARELVARGNSVTVLTGAPNYPGGTVYEAYRRDPSAFASLDGVEIVRVPLVPRGQGKLQLALNYLSYAVSASTLGAWKLRRRHFDRILIMQVSPATVGLPGVILRALKRAPTLFWVQDLWPDTLEAVGVVRSRRILRLVERCMIWFYANTDHLLAQSRAMMPRLLTQAPKDLPITYLPNWAETQREPDAPAQALQIPATSTTRDTANAPFKIFFLGNLGEAQDFPAVLAGVELLRKRRDIEWHLVGDGRQADWIRHEVAARGLTDRVQMHGAFPAAEMPRFHRQASALLVSLKADPLFAMTVPSKVQSYLAAGVPIVAMLDGEGARVIREANAGLTCPAGDSRALAEAVACLAGMTPDERARLGVAAKAYGRREFDFAMLVDRLEMLFSKTVMRKTRSKSRGTPIATSTPPPDTRTERASANPGETGAQVELDEDAIKR